MEDYDEQDDEETGKWINVFEYMETNAKKVYEFGCDRADHISRFEASSNYFQKLKIVSDWYKKHGTQLSIDWQRFLTPIEFQAYCHIKCRGLRFYPQYPVLNYFLDFADPKKKIGIELDGKDYHNIEKDKIRDAALVQSGWKMFRITGREMMSLKDDVQDYYNYDELSPDEQYRHLDYISHTGAGVIDAIRYMYYRGEPDWNDEFFSSYVRCLTEHQIVEFQVI